MKKFCESWREHAMETINFEKKKVIPLRKEQRELRKRSKICYICKETSYRSILRKKTIVRLESIDIIQVNAEIFTADQTSIIILS